MEARVGGLLMAVLGVRGVFVVIVAFTILSPQSILFITLILSSHPSFLIVDRSFYSFDSTLSLRSCLFSHLLLSSFNHPHPLRDQL